MSNNPEFTSDDRARIESVMEHMEPLTLYEIIQGESIPKSVKGFIFVVWDKEDRVAVRSGTTISDPKAASLDLVNTLNAIINDEY